QRSAPVFQYCPYRDRILVKDKQRWLRGYPQLLGRLRQSRYDLVVDLRTDGFAWLLRAGHRDSKPRRLPAGLHAVREHLLAIEDLLETPSAPRTRLWLSDAETGFASAALNELQPGPWLAIGPGCGGPEKVWPARCFAELANQLEDLLPAVVLLGGPGDQPYAQELLRELRCPALDLTGRTDILQAAAVIQRCRLFIGNDSGLGHLASAVTTPSLTLFGVGQPDRYRPWQEHAAWLRGADQAVENIRVDTALDTARELLA
ncbi:MAG: glycosyltransferase family 9 protein, partial [Thiotrichales bacterium]|nr:glycosyltransferase family 9 protein [Thiotrichales bacterium]